MLHHCASWGNCLPFLEDYISDNDSYFLPPFKGGHFSISSLRLIGVDRDFFTDQNGTYPRLSFSSRLKENDAILTLTRAEARLLFADGIFPSLRIFCFEELFPHYATDIRFIDNSIKSYSFLCKLWNKESKQPWRNGLSSYVVEKYYKKLIRKTPVISSLDGAFINAPMTPYQEVFTFKENRDDRCVISFDFNSMYAACLLGDFCDPKHLVYKKENREWRPSEALNPGIYRVILHGPDQFISNYHSIKYVQQFRKISFLFNAEENVETFLLSNEIEFYGRHFERIELIESIQSKKTIKHPFASNALNLYAIRQNFKKQNNNNDARRLKMELAWLHSIPKRRIFQNHSFHTIEELIVFFNKYFGLGVNSDNVYEMIDDMSNSRHFKVAFNNGEIVVQFPAFQKGKPSVLCLYAQVLANARVKMMEAIEHSLNFDDAQLCYCNIDSLHVSVPLNKQFAFFEHMKSLCGSGLGQLKVECIARSGYWLEIGRYWLFDDKHNVVMSKNAGIKSEYSRDNFQDGRTYSQIIKGKDFCIANKRSIRLASSLSYLKHLEEQDCSGIQLYSRFHLKQLQNPSSLAHLIEVEKQRTRDIKLSTFYELKQACSIINTKTM